MKTSVVIIAHNEERHIARCIESLLDQTRKPDEIVLIAHNCTDGTESVAREYPITVVPYQGPVGVPYARIKAFESVAGEIVACIDGDTVASKQWFAEIIKPLVHNPRISLVAGYVMLTNSIFSRFASFWQFVILKKILKPRTNYFAWGSSFACRKADYESVGGIGPIITLKEQLKLHFWAEDFYLSRALLQRGMMAVALRAVSYTKIPAWKANMFTQPVRQWIEDNRAIVRYFAMKGKR